MCIHISEFSCFRFSTPLRSLVNRLISRISDLCKSSLPNQTRRDKTLIQVLTGSNQPMVGVVILRYTLMSRVHNVC